MCNAFFLFFLSQLRERWPGILGEAKSAVGDDMFFGCDIL